MQLPRQLVGGLQYVLGLVAKESLLISYPPKNFSYEDRDLLSVQNVYKFLFTIQVQIALEAVIVLGTKILTL